DHAGPQHRDPAGHPDLGRPAAAAQPERRRPGSRRGRRADAAQRLAGDPRPARQPASPPVGAGRRAGRAARAAAPPRRRGRGASSRLTVAAGVAAGLGTMPLGALFDSATWVFPATAAIAVVTSCNVLARVLRLPPALVPLAGAAGLFVFLCFAYAQSGNVAGL